jgi:putative FmdB family regulatory protein
MPLYIYGCRTCDIAIEELRPMELADFPPVECPVCHALCEREVALFNIAHASSAAERRSDPEKWSAVSAETEVPEGVVDIRHAPGCPCCSRPGQRVG